MAGSGRGAQGGPSGHLDGAPPPDERWRLLLQHREHAISVVRRRYGSHAEAEDCVHDAMLRLVRRDNLDSERLGSLLTRAALAIAIDHRRTALRDERARVDLGGGLAAQVVSPDQVVADREDAARVMAALSALPPRQRQVLLLRLSGRTVSETARALGLASKSVEGSYTRARAQIRLALGALLGWVAARLRRVASPRGEAAVATVAALLFAGPLWGALPGVGHDRPRPMTPPGSAQALLWGSGTGLGASRGSGGAGGGGSAYGRGGGAGHEAGGGAPGMSPGDGMRTIVNVPVNVQSPGPHHRSILSGGLSITGGSRKPDPVPVEEDCIQDGIVISLTQDFCPN